MNKKKKKRIRLSGLIFIILLVYLLGVSIYYVVKLPVKNIKIEGLNYLTEADIIQAIGLEDNYPMIKVTKGFLSEKIDKLPLVESFQLKRNLKGQVTIIIKEAKVLFYNNRDNKIVLSNEKTIEDSNRFMGYPTLVNYVPSDIYHDFVINFAKIDSNIITLISEIEYDPDKQDDIVVDDQRFLLTMNDGNEVYINVANIEKMNKYLGVVSKTSMKGILYLDSNGKNFIFKVNQTNEDEL